MTHLHNGTINMHMADRKQFPNYPTLWKSSQHLQIIRNYHCELKLVDTDLYTITIANYKKFSTLFLIYTPCLSTLATNTDVKPCNNEKGDLITSYHIKDLIMSYQQFWIIELRMSSW